MKKHIGSALSLAPVILVFGGALILSFYAQFMAFRVLGIENYGTFSVIYAISAIVSVIGVSGFDLSALRFFSTLEGRDKNLFVRISLSWTLISSIIFSIGILSLSSYVYNLSSQIWVLSILGCIGWSFVRLLSSLLRASGRFKTSLFIDRYCRDGLIGLVATIAITANLPVTLPFAVLLLLAGGVVGVSIALPFFWPHICQQDGGSRAQGQFWLIASLGLLLINVLELTFSRIEIILSSYIAGPEMSAALSVINVVSNIVIIPSAALTIVGMPIIARHFHDGNSKDLLIFLFKYTIANMLGGIVVSIPILIWTEKFVLLFGKEASEITDYTFIFITVIVKLTCTLCSAASPLILMSGKIKSQIGVYFVLVAIKSVCLLYFVPEYGIAAGVWIIAGGLVLLSLSQLFIGASILRSRVGQPETG